MRLFIAVDLEKPVLDATEKLISRLQRFAPGARWVNPANLHVTLVFLGEVKDEVVPEVEAIVRSVAAEHAALTLQARGGGGFGTRRHPRVVWAGLEGDVDALGRVQRALGERLAPLGFEPETRPFKPHLTLARAKELRGDPALARCVDELTTVDLGASNVGALVLYRSQLSPRGARYTPLVTAPLGG